jgi:lycopene cyclase-like protein
MVIIINMSGKQKVAIIGSGPAGLAFAAYLSTMDSTKEVYLFDSSIDKVWTCSYCMWKDELITSDLTKITDVLPFILHEWDGNIITSKKETVDLNKKYMKLNNDVCHTSLLAICKKNNVRLIYNSVESIVEKNSKYLLKMINYGDEYEIDEIVDASGHYSKFSPRNNNINWQTFYGETCTVNHNFDPTKAFIFDWSLDGHLVDTDGNHNPESFCYILPYSKTEVFLEETVLTSKDVVDYEILKNRLSRRKLKYGLQNAVVSSTEINRIPMNASNCNAHFKYLAIGSAGEGVNPTTGYSVAYSFNHLQEYKQRLENKQYQYRELSLKTYSLCGEFIRYMNDTKDNQSMSLFFEAFFKDEEWPKFMLRSFSIYELYPFLIKVFLNCNTYLKYQLIKYCLPKLKMLLK